MAYPPQKGAGQRVVDQLVEGGQVEAVPNPFARYDDIHDALEPEPDTAYRLAQQTPPQPEAELQLDVTITT